MALKGTEIVEKSNSLNEIRMNGMTLQQLRFFSIYLAKINARDIKTRKVVFPIKDFQKIMDLGRLNMKHFQAVTNGLLCQAYNQPNEDGGYTGFTLFKRCRVFRNDLEEWFVEIEASDDALPLMFNLRKRYFKYELWNALRLKSANQIAMYELMKQYENAGRLEISVTKLRERLDLVLEYPLWSNFKRKVLDRCQQALRETTDIAFTYERGKVGNGGKWLTVIFNIKKNTEYIDQLTLAEFIKFQDELDTLADEADGGIKYLPPNDRKSELEQSKQSPLWYYALETAKKTTAQNKSIKATPERYAIGILKKWTEAGYENAGDLRRSGEIPHDMQKPSFDIDEIDRYVRAQYEND